MSTKRVTQGLSFSPELYDRVKKKGGANISAYIRGLIERDLAGDSVSNASHREVLTSLCEQLRPELLDEFRGAVATIGLPEPRLLAELLHLVIEYAKEGGEFRGDFDPFIASTQAPHIAKACARARVRDLLALDESEIRRKRGDFAEKLRLLIDHAGLDKPDPTKDLRPLLFEADKLMKAVRDLPLLPADPKIVSYTQPEELPRAVAEPEPLPRKPPKPPSTGTTP